MTFVNGKPWLLLVLGLVYGAALAFIGFMLAGAGHGSYVLFFVTSAPVSFLAPLSPIVFWFAAIFPLLMWGLVGWLIGSSSRFRQRLALGITLLHYLSVGLMRWHYTFRDRDDLVKMFNYNRQFAVIGTSTYLLGQFVIWICWITRTRLR